MKPSNYSPTPRRGPVLSGLCLAVYVAWCLPAGLVMAAADTKIAFNIQADNLASALNQFAEQSGLQLIYTSQMTAGLGVQPLSGSFSIDEALQRLLQGSGLQFRKTNDNTVVLEKAPEPPTSGVSSETVLPLIDVNGATDASVKDVGFSAVRSSGATRTDTPLKEVPQTVNVVNSQVIEAQQAASLADVVRNVSGVVAQSVNPQGGLDRFKIRGFSDDSSNIMIDGMSSMSSVGGGAGVSLDNVERVEVMKGPESILAGSVSPGGVINVVTKRPTADTIRTAKVQYGSYGDKKVSLDLGGALTENQALTYRLNVSKRDADTSQAGYKGAQEDLFAPAIGFKNDWVDAVAGADITKSRQSMTAYTVGLPGADRPAKFDAQRYGNKDDHFEMNQKRVYYDLALTVPQDMIKSMTFNSRANYTTGVFDIRTHTLTYMGAQPGRDDTSAFVLPSGCADIGPPSCFPSQLPQGWYLQNYSSKLETHSWMMQHDMRLTFNTGGLQHKVLLGIDRSESRYSQYTGGSASSGVPSIDNYTGPYDLTDRNALEYAPAATLNASQPYKSVDGKLDYLFQDQLAWGKWRLLISYKRNEYTFSGGAWVDGVFSSTATKAHKWTHNYGLAYVFNPQVTAYVNRNEGFQPNSNPALAQSLPPTSSLQTEAGIKFNLFDNRLQVTSSVFKIEKSNVVNLDPITNLSTIGPGREVRGFETDLQGEFLPGWKVIGSFSYNDVVDPKDTTTGEKLVNAGQPKRTASLFTSYELLDGTYKGLGAGIGVFAQDRTYGEDGISKDANPLVLPGQAETDLSIFLNQPAYRLNFGIKNLFSRTLYGTTTTRDYIPLTYSDRVYTLSASYDF